MSVQAARSFLDEIPNVSENKLVYTPVAVFGYIGYRKGFELELLLPTWFFTSQKGIVTTPFEMVVFSIVIASLTIALLERGKTKERDSHPKTPFQIASDFILFLGFMGSLVVLLFHVWSLYSIYVTEIYSETFVGLLLSVFQFLIVIDSFSDFIAEILHDFIYYIVKKLMLW